METEEDAMWRQRLGETRRRTGDTAGRPTTAAPRARGSATAADDGSDTPQAEATTKEGQRRGRRRFCDAEEGISGRSDEVETEGDAMWRQRLKRLRRRR